jgi:DNA-3-methyladenine glycosylase II
MGRSKQTAGVPAATGAPTEHNVDAGSRLRAADPVLARLIDEKPNFDPRAMLAELPPMSAFGVLVFQIVGQQLSLRAAQAIIGRLTALDAPDKPDTCALFGGRMPEPQEILDANPQALRSAGMSRRKIETMRALAARFVSAELSDQVLRRRTDEEVETALTAIPGIGPWTVQGFLIIALDRPDVMPAGDLAIRRAVKDLYGLERMPSPRQVLQIAERWRPYRSLAASYLVAYDAEAAQRT